MPLSAGFPKANKLRVLITLSASFHHESARTFVALWALGAAQAALLAATHAALGLLFSRWPGSARQVCLLLLSVAVTALFWSKALIQMANSEAGAGAVPLARRV